MTNSINDSSTPHYFFLIYCGSNDKLNHAINDSSTLSVNKGHRYGLQSAILCYPLIQKYSCCYPS